MPALRDDNFRAYPEFVAASRPPGWQLSAPLPLATILDEGAELFANSAAAAAKTAAKRKLERADSEAD